MSYIQIRDTLKTMSNSILISNELKGRLSPKRLFEEQSKNPYVIIDKKKYNVLSAECEGICIKIKISVDNNFKVNKIFKISESNIFGINLENASCYFNSINYDNKKETYVCSFQIEETFFWR